MLCDHSNETTLAVFSRGTCYFSAFLQSEILEFCGIFCFVLLWQCNVDNQVQSLRVNFLIFPKVGFCIIRYFHRDHNAPLLPTSQIIHNHCLGVTVVPREIEDNATFWEVNKVHYGLCENNEYLLYILLKPTWLRNTCII